MKKFLAIIVAAALITIVTAPPASAGGDHGWATAGKILTGIIGLNILGHAIAHSHAYPGPAYGPPPAAYYYPREQVWVPGHYESRIRSQWVPGHWEIERFDRDHRGRDHDEDYRYETRRVWIPGHYTDVEVTVWIPGHWEG